MISIRRADVHDATILSEIAAKTFIESHGHSAKAEDINIFIAEKYNVGTCTADLVNTKNNYHLIYYKDRLAGFSNIIFNFPHANCNIEPVAKLERIYVLKEFYDFKLGHQLFNLNFELARKNEQKGIWLFVWTANARAIKFYRKNGFTVAGSFTYKISDNHYNPNYLMLLEF